MFSLKFCCPKNYIISVAGGAAGGTPVCTLILPQLHENYNISHTSHLISSDVPDAKEHPQSQLSK